MARFYMDLDNPLLTPREKTILELLIKKRSSYISQFRRREAHAIEQALFIFWTVLQTPHVDRAVDILV